MFTTLLTWLKNLLTPQTSIELPPFPDNWRTILNEHVMFYQQLNAKDKVQFEKRTQLFIASTEITGKGVDVDDTDKLLVAASAIIPVWAFPHWHYFNLYVVILLPSSFNEDLLTKQQDSTIQGMVGTGYMSGKMLLSKTALHYGFSNSQDKKNVGIHEFSHLIDMADGTCDGFPERLKEMSFAIPWFELVRQKIREIEKRKSNINPYGATNNAEFFSVATEYFFERPKLLKRKHPKLYKTLSNYYQQDLANIKKDIYKSKSKT